uniref:Uncharacterized protein n=1 Tax=Rhizophora mucronata TaxID=61149 RepID=A0A2P2IZU1_RHIMU
MHLQEKAVLDPKGAQQRICLRGKSCYDLHRLSQSPGNQMKKMPSTRSQSPKLERKPTPSTVQESSFQRSAVNAKNPELATLKTSQSLTRSVISLPKRKAHESSSPNVWR